MTTTIISDSDLVQVKMVKYARDPCFGKKHELHDLCKNCWIKKACMISFRNRK